MVDFDVVTGPAPPLRLPCREPPPASEAPSAPPRQPPAPAPVSPPRTVAAAR
jgi:hypothetical protein